MRTKMLKSILNATLLLVMAYAVSGCRPCQSRDPYAPLIITPPIAPSEILGYSVQNRPVELLTVGSGAETVLIIATIHGNEDAGTPLVYELTKRLRRFEAILQRHTVLIVPIANPDGQVLRTRENANGIDLNRNFLASNRIDNAVNGDGGLTEPESKILHALLLDKKPTRIVSIHQPLDCLDYDGPGEAIARMMSYYCPLPVRKLGSRPGSLGTFAGVDCGTPIITMELTAADSNLTGTELWSKYGYALLAAITYPELPQ